MEITHVSQIIETTDHTPEAHAMAILKLPHAMRLLAQYPTAILAGNVPDFGSENTRDAGRVEKLIQMRENVGADRFAELVKEVLG